MCRNAAANFPITSNKQRNAAMKEGRERKFCNPRSLSTTGVDIEYKNKKFDNISLASFKLSMKDERGGNLTADFHSLGSDMQSTLAIMLMKCEGGKIS